jgi:hypothetical protein
LQVEPKETAVLVRREIVKELLANENPHPVVVAGSAHRRRSRCR